MDIDEKEKGHVEDPPLLAFPDRFAEFVAKYQRIEGENRVRGESPAAPTPGSLKGK